MAFCTCVCMIKYLSINMSFKVKNKHDTIHMKFTMRPCNQRDRRPRPSAASQPDFAAFKSREAERERERDKSEKPQCKRCEKRGEFFVDSMRFKCFQSFRGTAFVEVSLSCHNMCCFLCNAVPIKSEIMEK